MAKQSAVEVIEVTLEELRGMARLALTGLTLSPIGESASLPHEVTEPWLRRYVSRLHERTSARLRVVKRPTEFTITRVTDAPDSLL